MTYNRSVKALWVGVVLAAAGVAGACMWDYDTLGQETRGVPDIQDVIAGRFDVNPDSYYEKRIELMQAERKAGTLGLDGFDNAAMAWDRLGDAAKSLEWLAAKESRLKKEQPVMAGDDWYRFFANRGTVYAHQWGREKKGRDMRLLDLALADLDRALKINPEAHFGREIVQVEVIKLMKAMTTQREADTESWHNFVEADPKRAQKGLIGMMALGVGWNNPEMHMLLASTIPYQDGVAGTAIVDRANSLAEEKGWSWMKEEDRYEFGADSSPENEALYKQQLAVLIANGKAYRDSRTAFVEARLASGKHPDKDRDFWDGLPNVAPVTLSATKPVSSYWAEFGPSIIIWGGLALFLLTLFLVIVVSLRQARKQRATAGDV